MSSLLQLMLTFVVLKLSNLVFYASIYQHSNQ